jgi:uncharacterized membrane protein
MRDWPVLVTVADLAWSTVLTSTVAYLSCQLSSRIVESSSPILPGAG